MTAVNPSARLVIYTWSLRPCGLEKRTRMSPFTSAPADDQPWYRKSWRHPIFRMLRPFHYCDTESHPTSTHAHRVTGLSSLSSVEAAWENHRLADFDEWFPGSQSLVHIFLRGLLKTLCIVYCGQPDLKIIFDATTQTEFVWRDAKDQYGERLNTINIIVRRMSAFGAVSDSYRYPKGGLLLGAIATFVTSNPPQTAMFDYNQRGPYICLLACFGLTLGNLIVGSALSYGLSLATPTWYREVSTLKRALFALLTMLTDVVLSPSHGNKTFLGSPSRICCTLVLLSYPFLSIGMATSVGALGTHGCHLSSLAV